MSPTVLGVLAAAILIPGLATVWAGWRSLSPPRHGPPERGHVESLGAETVSVPAGDRFLSAYRVDAEAKAPKGVVLLIHGWGSCGADMLYWARFLADAGWSCLALDMRGQGANPREPVVTLPDLAQDIHHAWAWMEEQSDWGGARRMLLGHSMGGAASLYAVTRLGVEPRALVLSAAFARVEVITSYVLRKWRIPTFPFRHIVKAVWKWRTGIDLRGLEPESLIGAAQLPILVAHGTADPVVPAREMQRLLSRAPAGTESVEIPGAGHSDVYAFPEYRASVMSFFDRNL